MAAVIVIGTASAQKREIIHTWYVQGMAEEQYNTHNGHWNLTTWLDYGLELNLWKGARLQAAGLSTYMQRDEGYVNSGELTFSGIDAPSRWFRLHCLSLSQQVGPVTLTAGVRNMTTDYFTDDEVNFFTGSPHSYSPVIASNYDLPMIPTAGLAAQLSVAITRQWLVTTTFYNGRSGDRVEDVFRLRDGVSNVTAVNYHSDPRTLEVGATTARDIRRRHGTSLYTYYIERLPCGLTLIGEGGYNLGDRTTHADEPDTHLCKIYGGVGGIYSFNDANQLGLLLNTASYTGHYRDTQLELNYQHSFGPLSVQPVLILDNNSDEPTQAIALLRLSLEFGQ